MLRLFAIITGCGMAAGFMEFYWRRLQSVLQVQHKRRLTVLVRPSSSGARWKKAGKTARALPAKLKIAAAEQSDLNAMGILVHGCHLEAESWEDIVWGVPPTQLGRLPHAVLLAWEERAHIKSVVCGTGASRATDGRLEGQYTVDLLFERLERLREFDSFKAIPLPQLASLLKKVVVPDVISQNTIEEVEVGLKLFAEAHCHKAVLVSSPTHLPRCLACACKVETEQPELFDGSVWASPSDTSYHNFSPSDVVVVEPPHRGDRDTALDRLPFHEMVKRSYMISRDKKQAFLEELDALLGKYGV